MDIWQSKGSSSLVITIYTSEFVKKNYHRDEIRKKWRFKKIWTLIESKNLQQKQNITSHFVNGFLTSANLWFLRALLGRKNEKKERITRERKGRVRIQKERVSKKGKRTPWVNFTNVLRAAFAPIFLRQKSINLKFKYKSVSRKTFVRKSRA